MMVDGLPAVPSPAEPMDSMPPRPPRPTSARVPLPTGPGELRRWVEAEGTPLVDPVPSRPDRCVVTFAWLDEGDGPAPDEVVLVANKLTDLNDPVDSRLHRLDGEPAGWAAAYEVPSDWRCSYLYALAPGGTRRDPRNPRRIASKWEVGDLSLAEMPDAPPAGDWERRPGVAAGVVESFRHRSEALGNERTVWVARTGAGLDRPAERVLVLFDGEVWAQVLPILPLLDNLAHDGAIPPTLVVMIDSLGPARREAELTCNPDLLDLVLEVTGRAADRAGTPLRPGTTVVAGQSLGGLAAGWATLVRPDVFGGALCQSPSLWWPNRAGAEEWLTRAYLAAPERPSSDGAPARRLALQVGTDEWVLLDPMRRLRAALDQRSDCTVVDDWEFRGGHDHACWQAGIARGLVPLLAAPAH